MPNPHCAYAVLLYHPSHRFYPTGTRRPVSSNVAKTLRQPPYWWVMHTMVPIPTLLLSKGSGSLCIVHRLRPLEVRSWLLAAGMRVVKNPTTLIAWATREVRFHVTWSCSTLDSKVFLEKKFVTLSVRSPYCMSPFVRYWVSSKSWSSFITSNKEKTMSSWLGIFPNCFPNVQHFFPWV